MAFVPNTADPIPIVLHHTPSDTASPSLLYPGEAAVCHGPTHTKMWIGDGTTNRLFLSTNPADSPLLNQSVLGGPFLPLSGGTLAGPGNLTLDGGTLTTGVIEVPNVTAGNEPYVYRISTAWPGWFSVMSMHSTGFERGMHIATDARVTFDGAAQFYSGIIIQSGFQVFGGGLVRNGLQVSEGTVRITAVAPHLDLVAEDPVTAANWLIGGVWAYGLAGIDNTPSIPVAHINPTPIPGAGIRFLATQQWERDTTVNYGADPPLISSQLDQLGAEIAFFVSANGGPSTYRAMTLEQDGALRLSSAQPSVVWDKTGTDPRQWSLQTTDGIDENFWGLHEGGDWRFYVWRRAGPPPIYTLHTNDPLHVDNYLNVSSYVACNGLNTTHVTTQIVECAVGGDNPLDAPDIIFQRRRDTGNLQTGDMIGRLTFTSREQAGGTWQAAMIQAVATENHAVNIVGTELQFFTAANGSGGSGTPMMTLGQDANLTVVGTVTASGTLLTSDPDLKDDIAQAPAGALAKVCELPVIDYRWKHGRDSKMHRGFSADDVMRVMGEDSGCSADGAYSLADMNAVLWQATQELAAEVKELRRRIDGSKPRRPH